MAIMTRELSAACQLGGDPVEVGRAREMARKALPGWGIAEHTGLAELIVSELVTNSVRHAEGPIEVRVSYACGELWTEVHDQGAGRPVRQHATTDEEEGRGLELLDGLIDLHDGARGVVDDSDGPGKTIYVVVSLAVTPVNAS
jgi:anti-sigma regulatory factor (Ser/Thr protein kinase)